MHKSWVLNLCRRTSGLGWAFSRPISISNKSEGSAELTGHNFVAGQRSAAGTDLYSVFSPLGKYELDGTFHNATKDEITAAVAAAAKAFPALRRISGQ